MIPTSQDRNTKIPPSQDRNTKIPPSQVDLIRYWKQRAEAAESKLRDLEMQEPVGEINFVDNRYPGSGILAYCTTHIKGMTKHGQKLYAKPFPKQEEEMNDYSEVTCRLQRAP